jgi:hypothetical protein
VRPNRRAILAGILLVGTIVAIGAAPARAQMGMAGTGRSLGGYGAATIGQYYSSGMTTYVPYSGGAGGYVPYQGGYAGGFGIPWVSRRLPQTPIGGMSMSMTPVGGASRPGGRMFQPFGFQGTIGLESSMVGTPMTKQAGMRRTPSGPGFGYPFRMPVDLSGSPSGTSTMAMP